MIQPESRGFSPRSRRRPMNGTRPSITLSPSRESSAGSTVTEPSTATATTMMVPVAIDPKVLSPARYMPAIAAMTVRPDTITE
jgi:hypothetical protein